MNLLDKIKESNRIEGILRAPTQREVDCHKWFEQLPRVEIKNLEMFVETYQPGARLRDLSGLDVRIGDYTPPRGGMHIREQLQTLLEDVNRAQITPWYAHVTYERLHPFTDGNGRSGRMLWYWMMREEPQSELGFLHCFYYQTLGPRPVGQ